ncbi:MAG: C39 family peptidase [Nanoarchaeota archaeon]|nr:C39 family peptidase [Nanoarchaeota archaeon]MBU0977681.1 C39 family peptidase [Nanoarchaeota archaeon]
MKILNFPKLRQVYDHDCGSTAAQSVLAYYGIDIRGDRIMKLAKTSNCGTPTKGILKVLRKYNLKCISQKMSISQVKRFLDKEIPVILLIQAWSAKKDVDWENDWNDGHYVVAIGYSKNKMYFEDPSPIERTYLTFNKLKKRWHDIESSTGRAHFNLGIAVYGKKPLYNSSRPIPMG